MIALHRAVPAILVLAAGLAAGLWASGARPDPDFLRLHAAGALVAGGGAEGLYHGAPPAAGPAGRESGTRPFRMPPAAAVVMAPLGAIPEGAAWILWVAACGAMAAAGIGMAAAAAAREGSCAGTLVLAAAVPTAPLLLEAVARGNLVLSLLVLAAGSVLALRRGGDRLAGLLAGAAAAVHPPPVLLPFWFAWKRRWRAAAWGFGAAAAFSVLLPMAAAGPSGGAALLGKWASLDSPLVTELDEYPGSSASAGAVRTEGQSFDAAFARLLSGWKWYRLREVPLTPDPLAREAMLSVGPEKPIPLRTASLLALGLSFLVLAVVIFATGPAGGGAEAEARSAERLPLEAGLMLAAVPLVWIGAREHHLLLCAPALAALAAALAPRLRSPGAGGGAWMAAAPGAAGALLLLLSSDIVAGPSLSRALLARGSAGWGGLLLFAASALTLSLSRATAPGTTAAPPTNAP
jgi:hypothetical protein